MSERPVDNYEILEKKLDPTAQEQLSALKDNIRSYIQMGQFAEQAESAINEGEKGVNVEPGKLIAAVDA